MMPKNNSRILRLGVYNIFLDTEGKIRWDEKSKLTQTVSPLHVLGIIHSRCTPQSLGLGTCA
jgi:hypothetical protein